MVQYKSTTASRELSQQSINNCKVPTDVLIYFTKEDELVDKLLRRRQWEEELDKILDIYDKLFVYTIDGKRVSAKEFHKYVRIDNNDNEKGERKVEKVVKEDVH